MTHTERGTVPTWLILLPAALQFACGCDSVREPGTAPRPPAGGTELALDYDRFVGLVAPVLAANGCDAAGGCHGGGIRGTFELSPADAKDPRFDFEQVVLQVLAHDPSASPILTKPLAEAAGGAPHAAAPFDSREHPGYRAIETWILEGESR